MKKIKLFFSSLVIIFIGLFNFNVDAVTYDGKLYDVYHPNSGFTVFAEESNRYMDYNSWMIKSDKDRRIYYCIDPAKSLGDAPSNSFKYITSDKEIIASPLLNSSTYEKVKLLAYYGYGYSDHKVDHTDKKWYGITQVMIWRVVRPDLTWTFKTDRNSSTNKNLYKEEISEMNRLVSNHEKVASFAGKKIKLLLGESITLTDTNEVFADFFRVNNTRYSSVKREGNSMTITATKIGNELIHYSKKTRTTEDFALLSSDLYQDIIAMGMPKLAHFNVELEVTGGILNVQKIDKDTNKAIPLGDAKLKGAIYKIYDENDKVVGEITTDDYGKGSVILDYGKYYLKEFIPPEGYKTDNKKYSFEISNTNNEINLILADEVIKGEVLITKKKGGSGEDFIFEKDAKFEIINSNGDIVKVVTTNEKGKAIITLPYGKYILHQISGNEGYVFIDDLNFKVEEEKIYEFNLDNLRLSKLKVRKTDQETKKFLSGAYLKVYDEKNSLIGEGKTDKNGLYELENLKIGKYYVIETKAPKNYRNNSEKTWFEIKENGQLINIILKNKAMTGSLDLVKIDKINNSKLEGALFEIYDSFNKLVYKGSTNKNGHIFVDSLRLGKYCIYEKKAPKGYELSKEKTCFELTKDKQVISVVFESSKVINVPYTGIIDSFNKDIYLSLGVLFLISLLTVFIFKRIN